MEFNIINGKFKKQELLDIVTQFVNTKIKFHEKKISLSQTEEDIKMREARIRELQQKLFELRTGLSNSTQDQHTINGTLTIR